MSTPKPSQTGPVEQVEQQHEEIRQSISDIHRVLRAGEASPPQLASQLSAFCVVLEDHFRTEEAGGFFDQITDQAPRLSSRADKLCHEHQQMLDSAKSLVKQAIDGDGSEGWRDKMGAAFHDFGRSLMHHESEENELLQQAYTDDIGDKD